MLKKDIRELIITPSLKAIGLHSEAADNLVYGTGLCETNYDYLKQIRGSAVSVFQLEDYTYKSLRIWLSNRMNKFLSDRVLAACYRDFIPLDGKVLMWDLRYAAIMCRLYYWRIPSPLPDAIDAEALTNYYLKYYAPTSKATFEHCIDAFTKSINRDYS